MKHVNGVKKLEPSYVTGQHTDGKLSLPLELVISSLGIYLKNVRPCS